MKKRVLLLISSLSVLLLFASWLQWKLSETSTGNPQQESRQESIEGPATNRPNQVDRQYRTSIRQDVQDKTREIWERKSGISNNTDGEYSGIDLFQRVEIEAPDGPIYTDSDVKITVVLIPKQNLQQDTSHSYIHPYVVRAIREHWPLNRGKIKISVRIFRGNSPQELSFSSAEEMDRYDQSGWIADNYPLNLRIVGLSDHIRDIKNNLREQNPDFDPMYFQPESLWYEKLIDTTLEDLFAGDDRFPLLVSFPRTGRYVVSLNGNWETESGPYSFEISVRTDADKRIEVTER